MHRTQLRGGFERRNLPLVVLSGGKIHGAHSIRTHRRKDGWIGSDRMERKEGIRSHRTKEGNEEGQATLVIPCVGRGHADAPSEIRR